MLFGTDDLNNGALFRAVRSYIELQTWELTEQFDTSGRCAPAHVLSPTKHDIMRRAEATYHLRFLEGRTRPNFGSLRSIEHKGRACPDFGSSCKLTCVPMFHMNTHHACAYVGYSHSSAR